MAKTRGVGSHIYDRRRPRAFVRRRNLGDVEERIDDDVHIDNDNEQGLRDDDPVD